MIIDVTYEADLTEKDLAGLKASELDRKLLASHPFAERELHKWIDEGLTEHAVGASRLGFAYDNDKERVLTSVALSVDGHLSSEETEALVDAVNAQLADGGLSEPESVKLADGEIEIFPANPTQAVVPLSVAKRQGTFGEDVIEKGKPKKYGKKIENYLREGNLAGIREYYAKGGDLNAVNKWGNSLLMAAIAGPNEAVPLYVIRNGGDVAFASEEGQTPLHSVGYTGYVNVAEMLIRRGADVNAWYAAQEMTPLMIAANRNYLDLVRLLVEKGARINAVREDGHSPLTFTSSSRVVTYLLEQGREIYTKEQVADALERAREELEEVRDYQTEEVIEDHVKIVEILKEHLRSLDTGG